MTPIGDDPAFAALRRFSAALGRDPAQVQGPGGNTSIKRDGVLWVKASGTWLAQAEARDIFVPVLLEGLLAALADADEAVAEDVRPFVVAAANPSGLRPSIETTMHGALPHPVVVHVHCVDTMAWAARADADAAAAVAPLLRGVRWACIPYVRPGAPLTRAILRAAPPGTDVLVLGNHGLVVGGADVQQAAERLADVRARLRRRARPMAAGPLARIAAGPDYVPAADPATHTTAIDPASLAVARLGSLYPDHVIFLGPGVRPVPSPANPERPAPTEAAMTEAPAMLVAAGTGVLLHRAASPAAIALARCLADVTARLDPGEPIRVLAPAEEAALLGWDAEKYRQGIDAAPPATA